MRANSSQWKRIATAIDAVTRQAPIGIVRSGRGGSAPRVFSPGRGTRLGPDDQVVARVFEPEDLFDVEQFPTTQCLDGLADVLIDLAWEDWDDDSRASGPPLSVLMHGPPGVAMTVLAHMCAWGLDADLVQVFASAVLPSSNGGSQPIVAPAVNLARGRRRSVIFIDQLEALAVADRQHVRRQRAMNDLLGEALRPNYRQAPVVIAAYGGHEAPHRRLTDRFDHIGIVDAAESDDAEAAMVPARSLEGGVRTAPAHVRVQRPVLGRPSFMGSAA
jgi:hypothetical protein